MSKSKIQVLLLFGDTSFFFFFKGRKTLKYSFHLMNTLRTSLDYFLRLKLHVPRKKWKVACSEEQCSAAAHLLSWSSYLWALYASIVHVKPDPRPWCMGRLCCPVSCFTTCGSRKIKRLLQPQKKKKKKNLSGEGNGTPLQYSCLENPMDRGAWKAAVHGVTKSRTWLSNFAFTFHFHALEKEMATHSSVLAWRIPGTG